MQHHLHLKFLNSQMVKVRLPKCFYRFHSRPQLCINFFFHKEILLQKISLWHMGLSLRRWRFSAKIITSTRTAHKSIKKEVIIINNLLNGGDGESRTHVRNGNKRTSTSVGLLFLSVLRHEPIPYIPIKHFRLYRVWLWS